MSQKKKRKHADNGRNAGLESLRRQIVELSELVALLPDDPSHMEKRMIAARMVDAWESAYLFAPAEVTHEHGKWISELIGEVNGYCARCGKPNKKGFCKVCEIQEQADIAGEGGSARQN